MYLNLGPRDARLSGPQLHVTSLQAVNCLSDPFTPPTDTTTLLVARYLLIKTWLLGNCLQIPLLPLAWFCRSFWCSETVSCAHVPRPSCFSDNTLSCLFELVSTVSDDCEATYQAPIDWQISLLEYLSSSVRKLIICCCAGSISTSFYLCENLQHKLVLIKIIKHEILSIYGISFFAHPLYSLQS